MHLLLQVFKSLAPFKQKHGRSHFQEKISSLSQKQDRVRRSAFSFPIHHNMVASAAVTALVVAPTRELAMQIDAECKKYSLANSLCVYGGVPIHSQIAAIKKRAPTLIVATPGRLCDLVKRNVLELTSVKFAVLDEADRMLDMGFGPAIREIFSYLPASSQRQTLPVFGNMAKIEVRRLAATFLRDGEDTCEVFVGDKNAELEANSAVSQLFIKAQDDEKDEKLYNFINTCPGARV